MPRVVLVLNPAAGRGAAGRLLPEIVAHLRELGVDCKARSTRAPGEATLLVAEALRGGADCVAIAGGDGTVHEAVNGYFGTASESQALALIPAGTGNDFAKMLGLGNDWRLACSRIAEGRRKRVDLGRCNGKIFANGIGAGFDAQVALEANGIRWLRGNAVYGVALARILMLRYATPMVRVTHDAGVFEGRITMLAAANGTTYGGAFRIAPDADVADGLLDLMIADALTRIGIVGFIPHVLRGTHAGRRGITMLRTRRVLVETGESLVVHAGGEILDRAATRLEIEALPGALLVAA